MDRMVLVKSDARDYLLSLLPNQRPDVVVKSTLCTTVVALCVCVYVVVAVVVCQWQPGL